jgi:glycosyltransferase involved in cell wall biosynthesis
LLDKREEVRLRTRINTSQLMSILHQQRRPYQRGSSTAKKFSVALFSHSTALAGTERCMLRFAKELDSAHLRPIVVLPNIPGPLTEELRKAEIEFTTVPQAWWCLEHAVSLNDRWIHIARSARVGWQVKNLLRDTGAEVVGTTSSVVPGGAIGALLAGVRHVWHVREFYSTDTLRPTLGLAPTMKLIELLSSAVVVPTQKVAALFPDKGNVQVVPEGIDASFFDLPKLSRSEARRTLSISSDSRVITVVATIEPSKNLSHAIRVLKDLVTRGMDVTLILCGGCFLPDYKQQLEDEAQALSVSDRVCLTGFRQDVIPVYDASDVLLVTSLRESFGLTIVEAMARCVPVVATRCGGPEELISDGETGFLVDISDTEVMADRIVTLLESDAVASSVVERARMFATHFCPAKNFAMTLRSYGLHHGG